MFTYVYEKNGKLFTSNKRYTSREDAQRAKWVAEVCGGFTAIRIVEVPADTTDLERWLDNLNGLCK